MLGILLPMIGLCGMSGCISTPSKVENKVKLVGADKDAHGCIASAGYQWSEIRQECIRPWEKGMKLSKSQDSTSTTAAYLVFSKDSSEVEIYAPSLKEHPILKRMSDKEYQWKGETEMSVKFEEGEWSLLHKDIPLYWE